ncbi:MAG: CaiB/BaiF CoA transferase family protein [Aquabacterium sp.]
MTEGNEEAPPGLTGPLSGLCVVELGFAIAGPLAGTLMADLGADVVKVEQPGVGDGMRHMGPKVQGVGLWWLVAGRNKRCITADIKTEAGAAILRGLLAQADILVENFRPGVLDRLGFGWQAVHALNPRLIMLSISGFGQSGPRAGRPGFGKLAEAFSGATNLTGDPQREPVHPSYSLGDVACALMGAFGAMSAVHARGATGQGQQVDLALYEPLFRLIDWQLPLHTLAGTVVRRNGPRFPFGEAFLTELCQTRDGDAIVFSAATPSHLQRLAALLRSEGLDGDFSQTGVLGDALRGWIASHDRERVLQLFEQHDLVSGPVYTPADLLADPHVAARGNVVRLPHPQLGDVPMPNAVPAFSATPGGVRWLGAGLGEHTDEVLRDRLGYDEARIAALRRDGVI